MVVQSVVKVKSVLIPTQNLEMNGKLWYVLFVFYYLDMYTTLSNMVYFICGFRKVSIYRPTQTSKELIEKTYYHSLKNKAVSKHLLLCCESFLHE